MAPIGIDCGPEWVGALGMFLPIYVSASLQTPMEDITAARPWWASAPPLPGSKIDAFREMAWVTLEISK